MFQYSHLVEQAREAVRADCDPFVPVEQAQFIWHRRNGKSAGLVVSPRGTQTQILRPLACSTGSDTSGWLDGAWFNPYTVYGKMLASRWLNTQEYVSMHAEFAKIDACDWARMILQSMAEAVGAFHDDDERSPFEEMTNIAVVERFRNTILDRLRIMEMELVQDLGAL